MKLPVRASALGKKITLITTAFVLAVSSLTAAVPFVLAKDASAAPGIVSTATGFNALTDWKTDRAPVSGAFSKSSTELSLGVDGSKANSDAFRKTEGQNAALPANTYSIKASLFVDPEWEQTIGVRAGIWGVTSAPQYPIIEFSNRNETNNAEQGVARIQAWSTAGSWIQTGVAIQYGKTYQFEVVHNTQAGTFDYYVDGLKVASTAASTNPLTRIIFNNFNAGIVGNDYTVRWSQFATGTNATPVPQGLNFVKTGTTTPVAVDSVVNYKGITLKWDATPDTERYQIRVTDPSGNAQEGRYTGTPLFTLNDATRYGFFGTADGAWSYQIRSKSDTTKVWSDWTAKQTLTFDSLKPELHLPVGSIVGNAPYTFAITQTEQNPARAYVEIQQLVNNKWKKLEGKEIKNTNDLSYTVTPSAIGLQTGVATQIKVNSWDKAGNQISGTAVVTVDLEAPTGSIRYGNTSPINGNVIAYLTTDTPVQDIAGWEKVNTENTSFKKKYTSNRNEIVTFRDIAGNPGTAEVAITWIDKTAPVASISGVGQFAAGEVTLVGGVVDAHPMNSYLKIEGPDGYKVESKKTTGVSQHVFVWNTIGLVDGTYTVTFETRDKAQNKDASSVVVKTVIVDNSKPELSIASPVSSSEQRSSFTVDGTTADALSGINRVEYTVYALSGGYGSATQGDAVIGATVEAYDSVTGEWTFDVQNLASGFYQIAVTAFDNAGQASTKTIDVLVDADAPVIALSVSGRTISGTTTDPGRPITISIGTYGPYTVTPSSTNWSFTVPVTIPADQYDITATASDSLGNNSSFTFTSETIGEVVVAPPVNDGDDEGDDPDVLGATDDEDDAPELPSANGPLTGVASILGSGSTGASNNANNGQAVEGTSTEDILAQAVDANNTDGNALGLAWYWWLLIIAGGATGIWWLIAALRGRSAE